MQNDQRIKEHHNNIIETNFFIVSCLFTLFNSLNWLARIFQKIGVINSCTNFISRLIFSSYFVFHIRDLSKKFFFKAKALNHL